MEKEIIRYNIEDFRCVKNMNEFYKNLGLHVRLMTEDITVFDVHMCRKDCELLLDFMKLNNPKKFEYSTTLDWTNYSPSSNNDDIPEGELWIYTDNSKYGY